jgi:hypothetical protein
LLLLVNPFWLHKDVPCQPHVKRGQPQPIGPGDRAGSFERNAQKGFRNGKSKMPLTEDKSPCDIIELLHHPSRSAKSFSAKHCRGPKTHDNGYATRNPNLERSRALNKKKEKSSLLAVSGKQGLDIYINFEGSSRYLTSHRHDGILFGLLKDGITIRELSKIKSGDKRKWQSIHHSASQLIRAADAFIKANS